MSHLVEEQFSPLLPAQVHLFDSHLAAGRFLQGDAHDPRGTFADFDEALQVAARVAWTDHHLQSGTKLFVSQPLLLLLLLLLLSSSHRGGSRRGRRRRFRRRVRRLARVECVLVLCGVVFRRSR